MKKVCPTVIGACKAHLLGLLQGATFNVEKIPLRTVRQEVDFL